jgi:hypothetical protein
VVTWRTHERERPLPSKRKSRAFDRGTRRSRSVLEDAVISGRVGVKMLAVLHAREMGL